jgi:hypothetical protein
VGVMLSDNPYAEVTHVEHSGNFPRTTWVTYVFEVGIAEAEYGETTMERLMGLPEDMPIDWQLTPRDDQRLEQGVYRKGAGLWTSYELMKLSENGKISKEQVLMYIEGTDCSYRKQRRRARQIASSGEYKQAA